jgi:hypothetical protein
MKYIAPAILKVESIGNAFGTKSSVNFSSMKGGGTLDNIVQHTFTTGPAYQANG